MKIIKLTDQNMTTTALTMLKNGGLVIFPTETVYGALVDTKNPAAVSKLLTYKHRPVGKPISLACANRKMAEQYVEINQQADKIYRTLLPGPITVVSLSRQQVDARLAGENQTLGIRLPAYPPLLQLLARFGSPLTATSANSHGKKAPYSVPDLLTHLSAKQKAQIDLIVDGGALPRRPPSLVLDTTADTPTVLRPNDQVTLQNTGAISYLSHSPAETQAIAQDILTQHLPALRQTGLIIALDGALGAGKTVFTQGLAQKLQLDVPVTSPTYTYIKEYPFTLPEFAGTLYHLDVWRLADAATLKLLELDKIQRPNNLLVIEWFSNLQSFFQPTVPLLQVSFAETDQPDFRKLTVL